MKKITGVIFLVLAMCASTWAQVKITPGAPPGAINSTNVTNVTNNTVTTSTTSPVQQVTIVINQPTLGGAAGLSSPVAASALILRGTAQNSLLPPCNALRRINCH